MNRRVVALALLAAVTLAAAAAHAGDGTPLRDEDVVRAWVAGTPVDELVERIRTAETAFDLSDEMVVELLRAGLPDALVAAMRERQEELDAADAPPPETEPAVEPRRATVRIALDTPGGDDDEARSVRLVNALDEGTAEALGVPPDARFIDDVALFVACRTPDHVPDQWRSVSPLGRDFMTVPRHAMLAFLSGARTDAAPAAGLRRRLAQTLRIHEDRAGSLGMLRLDLPETIETDVEPDVAHDLVVGLAVHAGDRWVALSIEEREGVVVAENGTIDLRATVEQQRSPVAATTSVTVE